MVNIRVFFLVIFVISCGPTSKPDSQALTVDQIGQATKAEFKKPTLATLKFPEAKGTTPIRIRNSPIKSVYKTLESYPLSAGDKAVLFAKKTRFVSNPTSKKKEVKKEVALEKEKRDLQQERNLNTPLKELKVLRHFPRVDRFTQAMGVSPKYQISVELNKKIMLPKKGDWEKKGDYQTQIISKVDKDILPLIKLSPHVEGEWGTINHSQLFFVPKKGRLDFATEYTLTIDKNLKSIEGYSMKSDFKLPFFTSTVFARVKESYGSNPPRFVVAFTQEIDLKVAFSKFELKSAAGKKFPLKFVKEAAAEEFDNEYGKMKRAIIIESAGPLPAKTDFTLSSLALPSFEGLLEGHSETVKFKTRDFFRATTIDCYRDCNEDEDFSLNFSEEIHPDAKTSWVKIKPSIPEANISFQGTRIEISGRKKAGTTYTVTVSKALRDVANRTIKGRRTFKQKVNRISYFFPSLRAFDIFEPGQPKEISISTKFMSSFDMEVYDVQPQDWFKFVEALDDTKQKKLPPGKRVYKKTVQVPAGSSPDLKKTTLDLTPFFDGKTGNIVVLFSAKQTYGVLETRRFLSWLQATNIGLHIRYADRHLGVLSTELSSGRPLPGVKLSIMNTSMFQNSDKDGLSEFRFSKKPKTDDIILIGQHKKDTTFLPTGFLAGSNFSPRKSRWYIFGHDRPYLAGERVHLKGWVRKNNGVIPDLSAELLSFSVVRKKSQNDENEKVIKTGGVKISKDGAFTVQFELPNESEDQKIGVEYDYYVTLKLPSGETHDVEVLEASKEVKTQLTIQNKGPNFAGEEILVSLNAVADVPLSDADVHWDIDGAITRFAPKNRDSFTFGSRNFFKGFGARFKGKTDGLGNQRISLTIPKLWPPITYALNLRSSVKGVQESAEKREIIVVHPSSLMVGIKAPPYGKRPIVGDKFFVDVIVTDLEGRGVSGYPVKVEIFDYNEYNDTGPGEIERCEFVSTGKVQKCEFTARRYYRIRAITMDEMNRRSMSELDDSASPPPSKIKVSAQKRRPSVAIPVSRSVAMVRLTSEMDEKSYDVGSIAKLRIDSPLQGNGLISVIHANGILDEIPITLSKQPIEIEIKKAYFPGVRLRVSAFGNDGGYFFAASEQKIKVVDQRRDLAVEIQSAQNPVAPGENTSVTAFVKNANNEPVDGAEIALFIAKDVGEGKFKNPRAVFFPESFAPVGYDSTLMYLSVYDATRVTTRGYKNVGKSWSRDHHGHGALDDNGFWGSGRSRRGKQTFASLTTVDGRSRLHYRTPSKKGDLRAVVVASKGEAFGMSETVILSRQPFEIAPIFAKHSSVGTPFEIGAIISNLTPKEIEVDLGFRSKQMGLDGKALETSSRIRIPASSKIRVPLLVKTPISGEIKFQVFAKSERFSDAIEASVEVQPEMKLQKVKNDEAEKLK